MTEPTSETTEATAEVVEPTVVEEATTPQPEAPKDLFSQEQVHKHVTARLAREKEKHEAIVKQTVEKTTSDIRTEYEAKLIEAQKTADEAKAKATQTLFSSAVTVAAVSAGVDPANIALFSRMVELDEVLDKDGVIDTAKVTEAVNRAITAFPAVKGSPSVGGSPATSTTAEPQSLSMYEAVLKQLG